MGSEMCIRDSDKTLWLQRPDNGIWGGLWCVPLAFVKKEKGEKSDIKILETWQNDNAFENEYNTAEQIIFEFLIQEQLLDLAKIILDNDKMVKHGLTHFHWFLTAFAIELSEHQAEKLTQKLDKAEQNLQWVTAYDSKNLAQPKAMHKLFGTT